MGITDNAANVKKAIIEELKWKHLGCYAPTINLITQDLVNKTKEIISHFKRSATAKAKLDQHQKQSGRQPKKLIQSVPTRWNSEYYMFESVIELEDDLKATLAIIGRADWPVLTNSKFLLIREIIKILESMENVTRLMYGEKNVTASSIIVITAGILNVYQAKMQSRDLSESAKQITKDLFEGINTRLGNLELSNTLIVSTFLDPRYKEVGSAKENTGERARNSVITILTNFLDQQAGQKVKRETNDNSGSKTTVDSEKNLIWAAFDAKASQFQPAILNNRVRAVTEVQRYLAEPLLCRTECPMKWWKSHSYNYPNLSKIVRLKFGTVATHELHAKECFRKPDN